MVKNFSENYYFVSPRQNPLISIEGHEYATNKAESNWKERNGKIRIEAPEFEVEISLPKEDLKKLMVEAQDFFKKSA